MKNEVFFFSTNQQTAEFCQHGRQTGSGRALLERKCQNLVFYICQIDRIPLLVFALQGVG